MTSTIKVNNIQNQCGANIINESSNTITIGASGDTIALASGASQSGFGRSGSVDWQTTPKTATFTATSGEGYFINQSSAITMNLPAGSAGAIVAVSDYARNFETYNLTISPNGSEKIGGTAEDLKLSVNGQSATFVYVDSTKGWVNVQNAEDTEVGGTFISATGGTISDCGNFRTHIFTGPGTFTVSSLSGTPANNAMDYLVVAGGGGAGSRQHGAGGGAGGFRVSNSLSLPAPTMSPLSNPTGLTATVTSFPITVGGGGTGGPSSGSPNNVPGNSGNNSVFSTITSAGGGAGGTYSANGSNGGSGGGGGGDSSGPVGTGGSGNTPPVSPPQGNNGGNGSTTAPCGQGGGGGGAAAVGGTGGNPSSAGLGGTGSFVSTTFIGTPQSSNFGTTGPVSSTRYFAGGGAGGVQSGGSPKAAASGGGGAGTGGSCTGGAGTTNTGGGGGGAGGSGGDNAGGAGGSGIVMIRYKFQA